ncbi:unnamed protein product [Sympodiomycopsis kandeliae]
MGDVASANENVFSDWEVLYWQIQSSRPQVPIAQPLSAAKFHSKRHQSLSKKAHVDGKKQEANIMRLQAKERNKRPKQS